MEAVVTQQKAPMALKTMLGAQQVKDRFSEILGKKAPGFISSILSAANSNALLQKAEPQSVLNAAVIAATLDLPINNSLGMAYIVPFNDNKNHTCLAQFQLGYKGIVQLAIRSGQYHKINVTEVYEGEIKSENKFAGEYEFGEKTSDKVVGYMAYFRLTSGFEKYLYMSKEQCEAHGKKYSQTYKRGFGLWKDAFDEMSKKTVLKQLLSKFGVMSIDIQRAQTFDQSVVKSDLIKTDVDEAEVTYADIPEDPETKREAMREAMKQNVDEAQVVDNESGGLFPPKNEE